MKLRLRLAVATLAVGVPMVVGLIWLDARARRHAAEEELERLALAPLELPGARERCEAEPDWMGFRPPPGMRPPPRGRPPGPPPGVRHPHRRPALLFAYDEGLRSRDPDAPDVADLAGAIAGRDRVASRIDADGYDVQVLVRSPWGEGPCAFVLARGTTEPWLGALLPESRVWLLPLVVLVAAVLLAIGPVVRRLRRLTEAVKRSAASGYAEKLPVGGRDEIAELARAFEAAGADVRTQLAEKDRRERALREFLANTTHDVMIPLTVLQGHLATLRERAAVGQPADMAALVSAMDEAHYLASLVHNLGVTAKLESEQPAVHMARVDLNALVGRVVGRHRPIAGPLEVSLDGAVPEPPLAATADETMLEQAVSNVVYNAIRHNRRGGHVAVILEPVAGGRFRLRVLDDGPGIPADELARLVERGFRGNRARTRQPEGQGLGLSIASRVAQLHDMSLTLQASEFGGLQVDLEGALAAAALSGEDSPGPDAA